MPLELRSLSRDREQHLGVEGWCKIPTDGSHPEVLYKLDSHSATLAPLYNSPNQDLGSEIVECSRSRCEFPRGCLSSVCLYLDVSLDISCSSVVSHMNKVDNYKIKRYNMLLGEIRLQLQSINKTEFDVQTDIFIH